MCLKKVADLLNVMPSTVLTWIKNGKLKAEHGVTGMKYDWYIDDMELRRFCVDNPRYFKYVPLVPLPIQEPIKRTYKIAVFVSPNEIKSCSEEQLKCLVKDRILSAINDNFYKYFDPIVTHNYDFGDIYLLRFCVEKGNVQ